MLFSRMLYLKSLNKSNKNFLTADYLLNDCFISLSLIHYCVGGLSSTILFRLIIKWGTTLMCMVKKSVIFYVENDNFSFKVLSASLLVAFKIQLAGSKMFHML